MRSGSLGPELDEGSDAAIPPKGEGPWPAPTGEAKAQAPNSAYSFFVYRYFLPFVSTSPEGPAPRTPCLNLKASWRSPVPKALRDAADGAEKLASAV